MTRDPALARAISEAELQRDVEHLLSLTGWKYWHAWSSIHSVAGWPDLFCVRGKELLAIELKRENGTVTTAQWDWLEALAEAGVSTYIWRPSDWLDGTIEKALRRPSAPLQRSAAKSTDPRAPATHSE